MAALPAISLWQPWATAALYQQLKGHETRSFRIPDRLIGKTVAIHAAKHAIPRDLLPVVEKRMSQLLGSDWRDRAPRGSIVGTVVLDSCRSMDLDGYPLHANDLAFGDWSPGRFAWRLTHHRPLKNPIPWIGRQGWFTVDVPDDAE